MNKPSISEEQKSHLDKHGWVVIPEVITDLELCDSLAQETQTYISNIIGDKRWPPKSLIHKYRAGHLKAAWICRLKSLPVFASVWGTAELLSSMDAVAVSPPPEQHSELRFDSGEAWLHVDQASRRKGVHCYQGAVYLEECTEQDYCFRVLQGSHLLHSKFFDLQPNASKSSNLFDYHEFAPSDIRWFEHEGCKLKRVAVPKGGMVLWDSRTIHDNSPPQKDRPVARWRTICFVAMTPAAWADSTDLEIKQEAYENLLMTSHWPSNGTRIMGYTPGAPADQLLSEHCEEAKSETARRLAGVEPYLKPHDISPPRPAFGSERSSQSSCSLM